MTAADAPEKDAGASDPSAPTAWVVAGPNGAGKTTFATRFLPEFVECREFVNADLIAAGLSPFAPELQNFRAGRLMLTRIWELVNERKHFGFETTLAGRGYVRLFRRMKERGYRITAFFLWLPNAEMAVARVRHRVRQGGHDVPEADVRRRFRTGLENWHRIYCLLFDACWIYDATRARPRLIAKQQQPNLTVIDYTMYQRLIDAQRGSTK
jgi:predicted ABC-type ATPase